MRISKPARGAERTFDDLVFTCFGSHCRNFATFRNHLFKAKKMAPRLRGGPAVECLPLQAFATGGGGAYPRCRLQAMAQRRSCQAELTIDLHPSSFSICHVLRAQNQASERLAVARVEGGSRRSARNAAHSVFETESSGIPGAPVSLLNLSPSAWVITGM